MNIQNTFLFKILYSFILSMVPLGLYAIYKNELGKITGLLSVLFFVFTFNAFFGELISVNRQIVAEFFLVLSIFIWLNKSLPIKEKKLLLILFGIGITVSHYSLALIYLSFVSVVVILSSLKPQLDDSFSASTVLGIFGVTFLWYAFSSGSILTLVLNTVRTIVADLGGSRITQSVGGAGVIYGVPEVFTTATWINAIASGIVTLSLVLGILAVVVFSKKLRISYKYQLAILFASILFFISYLLPSLAATLNFTRFYALSFLFLSPCIAIGALGFLKIIQRTVAKNKNHENVSSPNKHGKVALLLVAFLLCAYFLSQTGFVNYSTGGAVHNSSPLAFNTMKNSSELQIQYQFYSTYTQDADAFSAIWLSKNVNASSIVFSDGLSGLHVLKSEGLLASNQTATPTNTTKPFLGSFVYLDSLNLEKGILSVSDESLNSTQVSATLNDWCNLVYSNGNSAIWRGTPAG